MEGEYVMKEMVKWYKKEMNINRAESLLGFFARELQIFDTKSYNAFVVN